MLKPARLVKIYCAFPKRFAWDVVLKLQNVGIVHMIQAEIKNGFEPVIVSDSDYFELLDLFKIAENQINSIQSKTYINWIRKFFGPKYIFAAHKEDYGIGSIRIILEDIERRSTQIKSNSKLNMSDFNQLLLLKEVINDKLECYSNLKLFSQTKHMMVFRGWVEADKAGRVQNAMENATDNKSLFEIQEPKSWEEPPTLLKNNAIIRPFEIFTENYGIPGYRELDPTFIIAFSFTLIFGLMFADVGYGLSLAIFSIFVYLYTTKESQFRRKLNLTLILFGLSSAFFGFFLGDFFGIQFREGIIDSIDDIVVFLLISIFVGLVHMSIGLLSKILTNFKDKKNVLHALSLLLIVWAAFSLYFQRDILTNKVLLGIGILILLILKKIEVLKELSSLVMGAASYMRIAILGIGHLIINRLLVSSFLNLSGNFLEIVLFAVLFFIGSFLVLVIGVFLATLQVLRLHWLEFFSTFFIGKGYKFKPFKHSIPF